MQDNWKRKKTAIQLSSLSWVSTICLQTNANNEKRKGLAVQLSSLGWVFIICLQTNARQWEGISCYSVVVSLAGSLLPVVSSAGSWLPAFRPMQDNGKRWIATQLLSPRLGLCYLLSDQCRIMGRGKLLLNCRLLVSVHQSSRWSSCRSLNLRLFGPKIQLSFGPKIRAGWTDFEWFVPWLKICRKNFDCY